MNNFGWIYDPDDSEDEQYDAEELRDELRSYYGTAMVSGFPMAMADLSDIEGMDADELARRAEELGLL